jgi:hypothetical protein
MLAKGIFVIELDDQDINSILQIPNSPGIPDQNFSFSVFRLPACLLTVFSIPPPRIPQPAPRTPKNTQRIPSLPTSAAEA